MWGTCKYLSAGCFWAGFVSIAASIAIWFLSKGDDPAHGERFGIFVGLWAPTFFALSSRLEKYASCESQLR
jgi:succinate-acetate transporter protein